MTKIIEADLPQRYDPKQSEVKWQAYWEKEQIYKHNPTEDSFTIDTPPPTVSGKMHIGHAYSYAQQDFYARFQRMKNGNVFFPFGTDDNGLPTERLVEKLKNVKSTRMSRADFRALCFTTIQEIKPDFIGDWKRLGMSCDFDVTYSTIDLHCQATSQQSFLDLYKKERVYRMETPVAWCVQCQTAIAQAEFDNIEQQSTFNDIMFTIDEKPITVATTRPELIPACVAVAVHPDDKRYAQYHGKKAAVPLTNHHVPIILDEKVEMEKGTGIMMICTFGDKDDIDKWFRHKLDLRVIFTKDGKLNELAGAYVGCSIKEARKKIIEDLTTAELLVTQKQIIHAVNVHERCSTEIEFLKTPQWYIKVLDKKEELVKAGEQIRWHPDFMFVRYKHWVENLNWDWCISRQRYFGIPFPLWYDARDGKIYVADDDQLPVDPFVDKPNSAPADVIPHLQPETDVMDTWATSSVTPQIILNWRKHPDDTKTLIPTSLRPQGQDIIRTWAFYTIVKSLYHHSVVPWKNIAISGYVTDPHGQKMSKSKGNVVDPRVMMEKYCSDLIRYWAAGCKLGEDVPFLEKELQAGNRTLTKLWNASKFTLMNLIEYNNDWSGRFDELELMDRWILGRANKLVQECTSAMESYEHGKVKLLVEQFFWTDFCDNYLEIIKGRLYEPKNILQKYSAQYTLEQCLRIILKLLAPFMPFITEEIYYLRFAKQEGKKSIHLSSWPEYRAEWNDEEAQIVGSEIVAVLGVVRKYKSSRQLAMNAPVESLTVTTKVNIVLAENDLLSATKAKTLNHERGDFAVDVV